MNRSSARPAPLIQRGMTLIELMIAMLLGLIVVGGVLGIFVANSETHRQTDDLARIQENARVAVQLMGHSMREAAGNPCGIPPGNGLIFNAAGAPAAQWWSGGADFAGAFVGFAGAPGFPALGFPANGGVAMVPNSDAVITVSGNAFARIVIGDTPPAGAMIIPGGEGIAVNAPLILFACNMNVGLGVVFGAQAIAGPGNNLSVPRTPPFDGAVANMVATDLGVVLAEGWFVGVNARQGTSLFRATGNNPPEEVAPNVVAMRIAYLMPGADGYVPANPGIAWPDVIAAHIELDLTNAAANPANIINRTVSLTVNLRNRDNNPP